MLEHPYCYLFYLFKFTLNRLILGIICNLVLSNLKILLLPNLPLMMLENSGVKNATVNVCINSLVSIDV